MCKNNTCRATCTSNDQCEQSGLKCSLPDGYCAQCVDNSDCSAGEFCTDGMCHGPMKIGLPASIFIGSVLGYASGTATANTFNFNRTFTERVYQIRFQFIEP